MSAPGEPQKTLLTVSQQAVPSLRESKSPGRFVLVHRIFYPLLYFLFALSIDLVEIFVYVYPFPLLFYFSSFH